MIEQIAYFDAHCDTLHKLSGANARGDLFENPYHVDLKRSKLFSKRAQIFALFANKGDRKDCFEAMTKLFFRSIAAYPESISFCKNSAEAETAILSGKTAAFLSVEGAELLDCSLERLNEASEMGIRSVNITWNYENALSGSNLEGSDKGLTEYGRRFVRQCGKLGIAVDVSHISDRGFWDVLDCAEGPVIASHSNLRSLCPHPRNLTDEMFTALCDYGGVAGINLYSVFLGDSADLDTVEKHIEKFLALGGENHLGIGADFDGMDKMPLGIEGVQDVPKLWDYLKHKGYDKSVLEKLFFQNFMRIFN